VRIGQLEMGEYENPRKIVPVGEPGDEEENHHEFGTLLSLILIY